jgi:hypothetical protein
MSRHPDGSKMSEGAAFLTVESTENGKQVLNGALSVVFNKAKMEKQSDALEIIFPPYHI